MQKLVSRNLILRFKEDRKIIKGQRGIRGINKPTPTLTFSTRKPRLLILDPVNRSYPESIRQAEQRSKLLSKTTTPTLLSTTTIGTRTNKSNRVVVTSNPQTPTLSPSTSVSTPTKRVVKTTPTPTFYGTKAGGSVLARGNNFNNVISDELKLKLIDSRRFTDADFNDVASFQNALNRYFVDATDVGAGLVLVDGKWGNQTLKAFNLALSKADVPMIGNNNPTPTFAKSTVIQTPASINIQAAIPQKTFNRAEIRLYMRDKGLNPYMYTGKQRKALRMVMNNTANKDDKALVLNMGIFKKGGVLPSRNLIERFKMKRGKEYSV